MKLILSRKGMDSSCRHGVASPILPDGTLVSLPIPEPRPELGKGRPYSTIRRGGLELGELVAELTRGRLGPDAPAHLDPDLDPEAIPRRPGWLPTFGQDSAAESHLRRHGVAAGDLFLYFGWFRQTEKVQGRLRFEPGAPDLHLLFGWLQVDRRIPLEGEEARPEWAADHPHCRGETYSSCDSLYVARERLEVNGGGLGSVPGGGLGPAYSETLRLTGPGENRRSVWLLPEFFHHDGGPSPLTYHRAQGRWRRSDDWPGRTRLETVGRGQEFVFELPETPAAHDWLARTIRALHPGA